MQYMVSQQGLIDLTIGGRLPASWVHSGNQYLLDSIVAEIPQPAVFLPQILTCLEQIHELIRNTSEYNLPTGLHLGRVGRVGALLARKANLSWNEQLECLYGGWLHDVGKIYVPEYILDKPGRLTDEEYELIKGHVAFGVQLLQNYPHLQPFIDPVRYHHERWDGNGYPYVLKGEDIPITGRVICIADSYDAMTNFRPYPPYQRSYEATMSEIDRCAGSHFDRQLAKVMLNIPKEELESII